mgnify:CR=1 FL=1
MGVFEAYARYYDLFYGDKDYRAEAAFVDGVLRSHGAGDSAILEIGCGTGRHAAELVRLGHRVHGIDVSEAMLQRAAALGQNGVSLELGDARTYRAGRTFDAVVSLFHVMSYQVTNADLLAAFSTAAAHLETGGLFLFDCWYGPAVLTERPEVRTRVVSEGAVEITRVSTPRLDAERNVCEVDFDVTVRDAAAGTEEHIAETHPMRYLFSPEVTLALDVCGMSLEAACEWGTGAPLSFATWNATFLARKR